MLVGGHKSLLSRLAFVAFHLHIIATDVHQIVVGASPSTLGNHRQLKGNPNGAFGLWKGDVRINTDGTSYDLIMTSWVPVGLHQVNMAHIGQRNSLGGRCGSHDDTQALGLGTYTLLESWRKGV